MFNNNHVGRPSNDELKQKRNMKVLLYSAPILVIAFVAILGLTGNLNNLMGNSVTGVYCDNGYKLSGENCIKTLKEKAYFLGDVNKNNRIDVGDSTTIQKIVGDYITPDDFEKVLADTNEDGNVNVADLTLLQKYFAKDSVGTNSAESNIGKKRVCAAGYTLKGYYCYKTETIPAKSKGDTSNQYVCQDQTYVLEGTTCKKTLEENPILIGDINKDGTINIDDQTYLDSYFAGREKFDDTQMLLADLDNNGAVDVTDKTYLQLYFAGSLNRNSNTSGGSNGSGYEAYEIGKTKICPVGYSFNSNKTLCTKIDVVNAILK